MKVIEIERLEFNEKTLKFDRTKRCEEYSDEQVRKYDLCTICAFPEYPECSKTCPHYKLLEKQSAKCT